MTCNFISHLQQHPKISSEILNALISWVISYYLKLWHLTIHKLLFLCWTSSQFPIKTILGLVEKPPALWKHLFFDLPYFNFVLHKQIKGRKMHEVLQSKNILYYLWLRKFWRQGTEKPGELLARYSDVLPCSHGHPQYTGFIYSYQSNKESPFLTPSKFPNNLWLKFERSNTLDQLYQP